MFVCLLLLFVWQEESRVVSLQIIIIRNADNSDLHFQGNLHEVRFVLWGLPFSST